jgi:hypothetical protein
MIAFIQQLYDVERTAAELAPEARQTLRQEHSVPLLAPTIGNIRAVSRLA